RLEVAVGIESLSVEERFFIIVQSAVFIANLFHGFFINIRTHQLLSDSFVIRRSLYQSPPAKLCEEPFTVFRLWVIAVPGAKNHVIRVLYLPTITIVVMSLQTPQYGVLITVNISRFRHDS